MEDNSSFPTYIPTPIRLLDGSYQNLDYNPTPIDELNRYAPDNFSISYEPLPATHFTSKIPSYSPVILTRVTAETFGYSPLAYVPKSDVSNSDNLIVDKRPASEPVDDEEAEKRKKILSLYSDLYDNPPKPPVTSTRRISMPKCIMVGFSTSSPYSS